MSQKSDSKVWSPSQLEMDQTPQLKIEVRKQLVIAWPMVVTNMVAYAIIVASLMFVGHLGEIELSSAALGNSLASVTGFTLMIGLGSGLETLCGQAYGARQFHLLGVYYQASVLVLLCCAIPVTVLWWKVEVILRLLGQDAEIARMSGIYMKTLIPALWAAAITQPTIKYLQTQSVVLPIMVCSVTTFLVHIPLAYLLVVKMELGGFRGGALAVDISYWVLLIQLLVYVACSNAKRKEKTWDGFKLPRLETFKVYLRLALPSAFMICLQYWAFEILTILSGLMPNPAREVSLLSICLNTVGMAFTLPFGLSAAASTRISNELGAGSARGAKLALKVVTALSMFQATTVALCMILLRKSWGGAFSNEPEVVSDVAGIMPFVALGTFMDGIQGVLGGVLRGCGLQDIGTIINLGAFYGVGVPSALLLGFYFQFRGKGLYIGCLIGLATQLFFIVLLVALTNWDTQVGKARKRMEDSEKPAFPDPQKIYTEDVHAPLLTA